MGKAPTVHREALNPIKYVGVNMAGSAVLGRLPAAALHGHGEDDATHAAERRSPAFRRSDAPLGLCTEAP